jgi:hypothetical protein
MTPDEIDRYNARELWQDAANHLTVAREAIEQAQASLEELNAYRAVADLERANVLIGRLDPLVQALASCVEQVAV